MFLGISRVPNYKLRNMSVFILVYGSKVCCQVSTNGKILPISCAWQDSAKHMKLAAVHDFGRLNDETRGKHTETKKWHPYTSLAELCQFCTFGRILPSSCLWQPYKNLADVTLKLTLTCFSTCITLSLTPSLLSTGCRYTS